MSQAEELLDSLSEDDIAAYTANAYSEPHIVINDDRTITVPDELRKIAVQNDHNIETVTFDCPRYWDEHDLSTMAIYVNYECSDGSGDSYPAKNITVDDTDDSTIHFTWTVSRNATMVAGELTILVCAKQVDDEGNEETHWNSERNNDMYVAKGMQCRNHVEETYPDIVTELTTRVNGLVRDVADLKYEEVLSERVIRGFDGNPDTDTCLSAVVADGIGLVVGETYIVRWDDREYTCVCYGEAGGNGDPVTLTGAFIGNANVVLSFLTDTGEPFFISSIDSGVNLCCSAGNSHKVAIYKVARPGGLPLVSEDDNGKILRVVDGEWTPSDPDLGEGSLELVAQKYDVIPYTYLENGPFPAVYNKNESFLTHRYAVKAGVTYTLSGERVRWHLAGYPIAIFTTYSEVGTMNDAGTGKKFGTTIIPRSDSDVSNVETDYNVEYSPAQDGYIWIAVHTSYNYLTVSAMEMVYGKKKKTSLKIQVFGDSMTDVHWGDNKTWVCSLQKHMPDYELDIINSAIGGNTMTKYNDGGKFKGVAWQMTLKEVTAGSGNSEGYDQFEPLATDRDLIIVWAGCNDWAGAEYSWDDNSIIKYNSSSVNENGEEIPVEDEIDITKIHGAVRFIIDTVSKRTTARLLFITPVQRYTPPTWNEKDQKWKGDACQPKDAQGEVLRFDRTLIQYVDAIKEACAFYGVPCLDMYRESGLNRFNISEYTTDGVHANDAGDERFAEIIAKAIKNGVVGSGGAFGYSKTEISTVVANYVEQYISEALGGDY